jgi:hypothetical protein
LREKQFVKFFDTLQKTHPSLNHQHAPHWQALKIKSGLVVCFLGLAAIKLKAKLKIWFFHKCKKS